MKTGQGFTKSDVFYMFPAFTILELPKINFVTSNPKPIGCTITLASPKIGLNDALAVHT